MHLGGGMVEDRSVAGVEAAMVAVRRRQSRRALARAAGASGVDIATQEVLDAVEAGGPVGVTGIADALGVDQPRASKLVAAAVGAGLLRREADQADGRRSLLALTVAGQERLAQVHGFRRARFAAAMAGWTPDERDAFADLLTRFVAGLED
jgi:DNA-binding MarR family transcriptional regulator